jgi:hypothetical protein
MQTPTNGLSFDISDDHQFKAYVVQQFGILGERTRCLDDLKDTAAKVPVIAQEVADLRSDATKREYKQWIHTAALALGLTLKNVLTHGRF